MVNDSVTTKNRATAFGILGVATLLGRMAGLIAAGTVANSDSSWRTLYFTIGLINLFLGLGLLLVKEPKRGSQDIELQETLVEGAEYNFKFKREDFKLLIRNKSNLWLILNFVDTIPGSLLLFLIFKYMEDIHNMQESAVNIVIIAVAVFGTIGTVLFGKVGDLWFQKDKRGKVIVALLCNATPMIFLGTFLQTEFWIPDGATIAETFAIPGAIIMVVSITIGMFINQGVGPNWMSSVVEVNLPEHRGTMIALANFADLLGNALGPLIGAYIASIFDIRTAMWSMLIFWLLNVLLWIPVVLNVRTDLTNVHNLLIQRVEILKKSE
jgi:MFS family permease